MRIHFLQVHPRCIRYNTRQVYIVAVGNISPHHTQNRTDPPHTQLTSLVGRVQYHCRLYMYIV